MDQSVKMALGVNSGPVSLGLEGTIGFGLNQKTECEQSQQTTATTSTTFNFPPGSCYGVLAMARASVLPATSFTLLARVSASLSHHKSKRPAYKNSTSANLCPVLTVLWAKNLAGAEVFVPSECSTNSTAFVRLHGVVERKILLRDFVIAYKCHNEAKLLQQFRPFGLCQDCLRTEAADPRAAPGQQRPSTRQIQRCNQTDNMTDGTNGSCVSGALATSPHVWWISMLMALVCLLVI